MSPYTLTIVQLSRMLTNLNNWLDKASEFATAKKFDPNNLLTARLAPDQFALARQVQAACDAAKFAAARLGNKEAPAHPDTETTIPELKARIQVVLDYLGSFTEADFADAKDCTVKLPFAPGMGMTGCDYLTELALPNFYFHITTAYAILRHNGVELGKRDFLGGINIKPV